MVEAGPTVAVPPLAVAAVTGAALVDIVVASVGAVTGGAAVESREPDAASASGQGKAQACDQGSRHPTAARRFGAHHILNARSGRKGSRLQREVAAGLAGLTASRTLERPRARSGIRTGRRIRACRIWPVAPSILTTRNRVGSNRRCWGRRTPSVTARSKSRNDSPARVPAQMQIVQQHHQRRVGADLLHPPGPPGSLR